MIASVFDLGGGIAVVHLHNPSRVAEAVVEGDIVRVLAHTMRPVRQEWTGHVVLSEGEGDETARLVLQLKRFRTRVQDVGVGVDLEDVRVRAEVLGAVTDLARLSR